MTSAATGAISRPLTSCRGFACTVIVNLSYCPFASITVLATCVMRLTTSAKYRTGWFALKT